jgi:hypothetical protein
MLIIYMDYIFYGKIKYMARIYEGYIKMYLRHKFILIISLFIIY